MNRGLLTNRLHIFFLMLPALWLTGCGKNPAASLGKPVTVTGTVTMDGEPAANKEVMFGRTDAGAPPELRIFVATTNASGEYTMTGVYPATYNVFIQEPKGAVDEENIQAEPSGPFAKYGLPDNGLRADVTETQTKFDFPLTSQ